jgi:hypothetical protein
MSNSVKPGRGRARTSPQVQQWQAEQARRAARPRQTPVSGPGVSPVTSREAKQYRRDARQLALAVADWNVANWRGSTPATRELRDGFAIALIPAAERLLAKARQAGRTPGQVTEDLIADLAADRARDQEPCR